VYVSSFGEVVSKGEVAEEDKEPRRLDVTWNEVITAPPVAFAEKVILSCPDAGTGVGPAALVESVAFGDCGTVDIGADADVVATELPAAFVATTVNVYEVAEASPWNKYVVLAFPVTTVYVAGVDVIV
jgi:hypothetical protein